MLYNVQFSEFSFGARIARMELLNKYYIVKSKVIDGKCFIHNVV